VQVEDEAKLLGKYTRFKTGAFYGGVGYGAQQQSLREEAQIMVGTPGRVLDLNSSGHMNLMNIAFLVLDEADRMFDMGFYPDLRKLVKVVPPADRRQTMLFSATLNTYVKNLAYEYTKAPVEIEIEPEHITVNEIDQLVYHVPATDKMRLLLGILRREEPESAIIFCNTKRYTETIAKRLRANGIHCEFISGDLPQAKRIAVIDGLKAGKTRFLVATDVAARGLDVEGLALVVNYDLPVEAENYVHRIGRTARAGKTGRAVSFASEQDVYELSGIEKFIGGKIPSTVASADLYGEVGDNKTEPDTARGSRRGSPPRGAPRRDSSGGGTRGGRDGAFSRERTGRTSERPPAAPKPKAAGTANGASASRGSAPATEEGRQRPSRQRSRGAAGQQEGASRGAARKEAPPAGSKPAGAGRQSRPGTQTADRQPSSGGRSASGGKPSQGGRPASGGKPSAGNKSASDGKPRSGTDSQKPKKGILGRLFGSLLGKDK
jgi:ATP-dependent RNA helicase RhlB